MKKINKKLLQNDKGIAIEKSKVLWNGEVKRLVHSRYLETALYILVVGLSLREGCPNSRSCNSLE